MEKRRALISTIYVFAFALLWMNLAPKLFPQFFPPPKPAGQAQQVAQAEDDAKADNAEANDVEGGEAAEEGAEPNEQAAAPPAELAKHPHQLIELGSLDPKSGYFMKVTVDTRGASIKSVELNDPRYTRIDDKNAALHVIGDNAVH